MISLVDGGYTIKEKLGVTFPGLTKKTNLANRAQAVYEAKQMSRKEMTRLFVGYRQEDGKLIPDFVILEEKELPLFLVEEVR